MGMGGGGPARGEARLVDDRWNRQVFADADVVASYASTIGLTPAERALVDEFVHAGDAVLDLGVGAGRTTPALVERCGRYVGIDVSAAMVDAARRSFPDADLRVGDAADLRDFDDASFDVVVFSYNGIDLLHPDEQRHRCLGEVARVLRPGGHFLFSAHDPRAVLARPKARLGWRRHLVAAVQTARRLAERVPSRAFWSGEGYLVDRVPPRLLLHMSTPARTVAEAERVGFALVRTVPGDPDGGGRWSTSWWYHAMRRT